MESTQCQLEREEATARHESERKHSNEQNAICWEQAEDTKLRLQTLVERITKEKEDFKRRWESKVDENASLGSSVEEWRKQMQHTYDENLRLANERNEELLGNQNKEWERKYILLQAELNTTRNELSDSRKKVRELQILVQEQTKASTNRLEKFESCQNLLRKQKEDYERKVQAQEEIRKAEVESQRLHSFKEKEEMQKRFATESLQVTSTFQEELEKCKLQASQQDSDRKKENMRLLSNLREEQAKYKDLESRFRDCQVQIEGNKGVFQTSDIQKQEDAKKIKY